MEKENDRGNGRDRRCGLYKNSFADMSAPTQNPKSSARRRGKRFAFANLYLSRHVRYRGRVRELVQSRIHRVGKRAFGINGFCCITKRGVSWSSSGQIEIHHGQGEEEEADYIFVCDKARIVQNSYFSQHITRPDKRECASLFVEMPVRRQLLCTPVHNALKTGTRLILSTRGSHGHDNPTSSEPSFSLITSHSNSGLQERPSQTS